jgi:hypothetical protein
MQIVATSSVDKCGPTVRNIAGNSSNSIYSMLRIYRYYYCDFIKIISRGALDGDKEISRRNSKRERGISQRLPLRMQASESP